jgi:hypothetical protein
VVKHIVDVSNARCRQRQLRHSEFPECWPVLRKYFGNVRQTTMMISAGLIDPRMKIENAPNSSIFHRADLFRQASLACSRAYVKR